MVDRSEQLPVVVAVLGESQSRVDDDLTRVESGRQGPHCQRRFTTVETYSLLVVKRSGVTEPFSRAKIASSVREACQGRPITEDMLDRLGQQVEENLRAAGSAQLSTHDVGLEVLEPLSELDPVAYMRFASVCRAFESLTDFEHAIAELRSRSVKSDG
ncbi:ATP cone domain-containing protein [Streptomyces sp. NPDC059819]|uniref:ATP cone domain-containing protein n=1 Tax=Streptomyces sp. NPDC059819 TaxID=3346963 RepID=UPI00364B27E0